MRLYHPDYRALIEWLERAQRSYLNCRKNRQPYSKRAMLRAFSILLSLADSMEWDGTFFAYTPRGVAELIKGIE